MIILNLKYFALHAGSSEIFKEKEADFSLKTCKTSVKLVKLLTRVFFIQETFMCVGTYTFCNSVS